MSQTRLKLAPQVDSKIFQTLYQQMPTVGQNVLITYQKAKIHECSPHMTGRPMPGHRSSSTEAEVKL